MNAATRSLFVMAMLALSACGGGAGPSSPSPVAAVSPTSPPPAGPLPTTPTPSTPPPPAGTSALARLAASMAPGTWAELNTGNVFDGLASVVPGGASGHILYFAGKALWNPITHELYYTGSDHIYTYRPAGEKTVKYVESSNSWVNLGPAPWAAGVQHGYDSALDPTRGFFYHRPFTEASTHRFSIATQTWDTPPMPAFPFTGDYLPCCGALEFFPELDGVVFVGGAESAPGRSDASIYLFREATGQWTRLATNLRLSGTFYMVTYNPVHHVAIFWSSEANALYKLDSNGNVMRLKDPPVGLYNGSNGLITVDPVSGDYIVNAGANPADTMNTMRLYKFDVLSDTWTPLISANQPDFNTLYYGAISGIVATPISNYGVVMFSTCRGQDCHVYLYKHAY